MDCLRVNWSGLFESGLEWAGVDCLTVGWSGLFESGLE